MANKTTKKTVLIFGGTSGLGLELARIYAIENSDVYITGRKKTKEFNFLKLDIKKYSDSKKISKLLEAVKSKIDTLVIAAGYFQGKKIGEFDEKDTEEMLSIGLTFPIDLINEVVKKQGGLKNLLIVTSTSQWTPRLIEPIYTAAKAGLGMFGYSASLNERISKTMVVGPSGMKTNFWKHGNDQIVKFLEPGLVATEIVKQMKEDFVYKFIKILRNPYRVIVEEKK